MAIAPRLVATVGLLALLPVAVWALAKPAPLTSAITAVNVVLIVGSLLVAMRPTAGEGRVFAP